MASTSLLFELVHARGYPVFAVMFGYGLVQLARRQDSASGATPKQVRSVLLRRNLWLVVFGFAHAALLYYGDFLGDHGIVGIAMTLLLLAPRRQVPPDRAGALGAVGSRGPGHRRHRGERHSEVRAGAAPLPSGHVDSLAAPDTSQPSLIARRMADAHADRPALHHDHLAGYVGRPPPVLEEPAGHRTLLTWTAALGSASPSPAASRPPWSVPDGCTSTSRPPA